MGAEVVVAADAVGAGAAGLRGVDGDPAACGERVDAGAGVDDFAGGFVAETIGREEELVYGQFEGGGIGRVGNWEGLREEKGEAYTMGSLRTKDPMRPCSQ